MSGTSSLGTVEVTSSHHALALLLKLTKFSIAIDGGAGEPGPWGTRTFSVVPGRHQLEVWFRYLGRRAGRAAVELDVRPGGLVRVRYSAPLVVTSAGTLRVEP